MSNYLIDSQGIRRSASYVSCVFCQKQFLKKNKEIKKNKTGQHFCNRECFNNFKNLSIVNMSCDWCKITLKRKKSSLKSKTGFYFCSLKCRNEAQSINGLAEFTPSHYGTSNKILKKCSICQKSTLSSSLLCHQHRNEDYIKKWKSGEVTGNQKGEESLHNRVRKYMFEKHNSKCEKCGWGEVHSITGKIPLTINHIDGDSSNSKEDNLELLCPNCHSLTHNYGALNMGKGRKNRALKLSKKQ